MSPTWRVAWAGHPASAMHGGEVEVDEVAEALGRLAPAPGGAAGRPVAAAVEGVQAYGGTPLGIDSPRLHLWDIADFGIQHYDFPGQLPNGEAVILHIWIKALRFRKQRPAAGRR